MAEGFQPLGLSQDVAKRLVKLIRAWQRAPRVNADTPGGVANPGSNPRRTALKITSTAPVSGLLPCKIQFPSWNGSQITYSDAGNGSQDAWLWTSTPTAYSVNQVLYGTLQQVNGDGLGIFVPEAGQAGGSGQALWIRFHLVGTLLASDPLQQNVVIDYAWQGTASGTVTVYNVPADVNYIFSGTTGKSGLASYDPEANKYWIVQMEC